MRYQDGFKGHMESTQKFDKFMVVFEKIKDAYRVAIRIGDTLNKIIGIVEQVGLLKDVTDVDGKKVTVLKIVTRSGLYITGIGLLESSTIAAGKTTLRVIDGVAEAAVKTCGMTALKAAGMAVGVLSIGFDIYTIVNTAICMHEGNLDQAAAEIERFMKELEKITAEDVMLQSVCSIAKKCEIDEQEN
ncbi:uncharacterized protein [Antedon mediterranea]|uniref:uncharacterized protein n=1 Tax=Antedon mediterranea TaxID=105859 RepID=UPI003AF8F422